MYKVVIADDEKRICSLIKALVNWEQLGLEVVETASDGKDALLKIREYRPDIVITDIRMPEFDAIRLLELLQAEGILPKVIVISGYAEFEYAKAAMQYGVQSYLLKPIQKDELAAALENVVKLLKEEHRVSKNLRAAEENVRQSAQAVRNQISQAVAEGQTPSASFAWNTEAPVKFRLALFQLRYYSTAVPEDAETLVEGLEQILMELTSTKLEAGFYHTTDKIWFLFAYHGDCRWRSFIGEAAELLSEKIHAYGEIRVAVSSEHPALSEKMAEEAVCARCWQWKYPLQRILCCEEVAEKGKPLPASVLQDVLKAVELLDRETVNRRLHEFRDSLSSETDPYLLFSEMTALWNLFCGALQERFKESGAEKRQYGVFAVEQSKSIAQAVETTANLIIQELDEIIQEKAKQEDYYVRIAKKYIHDNLHQTLTLETVSSVLHISPVYLSSLFKQGAGINFKDYIITVRIDAAKQMMRQKPEASIAQIGAAVGYPDQQYFSKLFSKVVGLKPSKYRKLYM